jgi:hypothetical protein
MIDKTTDKSTDDIEKNIDLEKENIQIINISASPDHKPVLIIKTATSKYIKHITTITELFNIFTPIELRQLFPNIVCNSGKYFVSNKEGSCLIEIDVNDETHLLNFNIMKEQLSSISEYADNINQYISDENKNYYCLIFKGSVIYKTHDVDEFEKYSKSIPIVCTKYYPNKNVNKQN